MSFEQFKVLTFDVVGTLIDFERGIIDYIRASSGKTPAELGDEAGCQGAALLALDLVGAAP